MTKKLFFTLSLLIIFKTFTIAQNADSVLKVHGEQITGLSKAVVAVNKNVDSVKTAITTAVTDPCKTCVDLTFWKWVLVFSPILIFVIALLLIRKHLTNFKLSEALAESELTKKTIQNPEFNSTNLAALATNTAMTSLLTPTIEISTDTYAKSSSRYIAFITSALTWIIILCLTSLYIYEYLYTGEPSDFKGFSDVLLALGIGVVPYAFNKVAGAIK